MTPMFRGGFSSRGSSITQSVFDPNVEPVFSSGQTMIINDSFDSYSTFSDAVAGGWRSNNGGTTQDTTTNAGGANIIIPGVNGVGNALRLVYDGISNSGGQEVHAWGRFHADTLIGKPAHACYASFDFRINPLGGSNLDKPAPSNIVKVKWFELWSDSNSDRAQFSTSYSTINNNIPFAPNDGTGTMWDFWATAAGVSAGCDPHPPQAGQCRPAATVNSGLGTDFGGGWAWQGAGKWHHTTYKYMTPTGAGTRDGVAQMWYDGTLIIAVGSSFAGVAVPNGQGQDGWRLAPEQWCTNCDLDNMMQNVFTNHFTLGSVSTSALWPFQIDYDNFKMWRD